MAARKRGPKQVTDAHKAAMATGRHESRTVAAYLDALELHAPRRGRRRTPVSIRARLDTIAAEVGEVDLLTRVNLIQERMNLEHELYTLETDDGVEELEAAFIEVAASYADRKGISYHAWREIGVPADVLKRAGIHR